jgi:hypothetical protein
MPSDTEEDVQVVEVSGNWPEVEEVLEDEVEEDEAEKDVERRTSPSRTFAARILAEDGTATCRFVRRTFVTPRGYIAFHVFRICILVC